MLRQEEGGQQTGRGRAAGDAKDLTADAGLFRFSRRSEEKREKEEEEREIDASRS